MVVLPRTTVTESTAVTTLKSSTSVSSSTSSTPASAAHRFLAFLVPRVHHSHRHAHGLHGIFGHPALPEHLVAWIRLLLVGFHRRGISHVHRAPVDNMIFAEIDECLRALVGGESDEGEHAEGLGHEDVRNGAI